MLLLLLKFSKSSFVAVALRSKYCSLANDRAQSIGKEQSTRCVLAIRTRSGENLPKAERFIARPRHNGASIGRHGQIQHSVGVAGQGGNLGHAWVPPYDNLVKGVAVRRNNFVAILRPSKIAHLRAGINLVEARTR